MDFDRRYGLFVKGRRTKFQSFFQPYLGKTCVLVAPHHRAATSWGNEVHDGFNRLAVGCAAVGTKSCGHPTGKSSTRSKAAALTSPSLGKIIAST